ncbi:hypothetical protein [Aggregatilinea lenta]|uniref:hypothetical protein n=1 Tax=Aggregatilinea lenta TaxID=913108 RepID=UPI0013C2CC73|nr:hypothetical protein [Aggregatilinea lenta]
MKRENRMELPASSSNLDPQAPGVRGWIGLTFEVLIITALVTWELSKYAWDRFEHMSGRARGAILISAAILLLGFTGTLIARALHTETPPTIRDRIGMAPFSLDTRPSLSLVDGSFIAMPASFGDFERISGEPADASLSSQLNLCLLDTTVGPENVCNIQIPRQHLGFERYRSGEGWVDVAVAQIDSVANADETIAGLYRYARRIGHTGNFAIYGVGPVDYFYGQEPGWISFAYARDTWIVVISTRSPAMLEQAITQFPY